MTSVKYRLDVDVRILIVNKYFPPDTANTAQLLGELSEDLAVENRVEVVVGRPSYDPGRPNRGPRESPFAPSPRAPWVAGASPGA